MTPTAHGTSEVSALLAGRRTIRAAIIDDERLSRRRILDLLAEEPDIDVVVECGRATEAIARLKVAPADLLFLDVEMPRATGFDILRRLTSNPAVIFTTAHEAHAVEAFGVGAVDYLLKPFDDHRFRQSLDRARSVLAARSGAVVALSPPPAEKTAGGLLHRLAVRSGGAIVFIRVEEVDWFETAGNYVRVRHRSAAHLMREALANLEEQLDPRQFVRISRSAIVNIDRVVRLLPAFNGDYVAELRDGSRLPVLAKYRSALQRVAGSF